MYIAILKWYAGILGSHATTSHTTPHHTQVPITGKVDNNNNTAFRLVSCDMLQHMETILTSSNDYW